MEASSEWERALAEAALAQQVVTAAQVAEARRLGGPFGTALRAVAGARAWQIDVIVERLGPPPPEARGSDVAPTPFGASPSSRVPVATAGGFGLRPGGTTEGGAAPGGAAPGGAPREPIPGGLLAPAPSPEDVSWLPPAPGVMAGGRWGPGRVVDGLEIVRSLGAGGMGEVFLARGAEGSEYALKVLEREASAELRERFRREGEAQARVDGHPHVLRVRRSGEVEGVAYLVVDLASGGDLEARVKSGPLPIEEVIELGVQLADALEHAHRHGVLHRDLKPANVLFDAAGAPKVADFGLAQLEGADALTKSEAALGTPSYMAPEQADRTRGETGPATDVYGLGALLFATLAGHPPFVAEGRLALITRLLLEEAPRLRTLRADVPPALEAVIAICLRKDPRERFASAAALRDALEEVRDGRMPSSKPSRRSSPIVVAALLALGVLAAAVTWVTTQARAAGPRQGAAPLAIEWTLDPVADFTLKPRVLVSGRVHSSLPEGRVRVGDQVAAPLDGQGAFSRRVSLEPGPNSITVELLDGAKQVVASRRVEVRYAPVPGWFQRIAESRRPPLPLPEGLVFGEDANTYRYRDGSILVWIPAGTFVMGRPADELITARSERRVQVTLTRGFFLGKYEVTWGQWDRFVAATHIDSPHERSLQFQLRDRTNEDGVEVVEGIGEPFVAGDDHPFHGANHSMARIYVNYYGLRLPTEAEWEFAARGEGAARRYPWGNMAPSERLLNRHDPKDAFPYTAPVGSCPDGASPFGCHDLAGNVAEITGSLYAPYPEGPLIDPRGPLAGSEVVVRGGSFMQSHEQRFLVFHRTPADPVFNDPAQGFRVALSPR